MLYPTEAETYARTILAFKTWTDAARLLDYVRLVHDRDGQEEVMKQVIRLMWEVPNVI